LVLDLVRCHQEERAANEEFRTAVEQRREVEAAMVEFYRVRAAGEARVLH
jgi:hypothetical protein